ncbi:MAG TPA: hypothetical protein VKQ30_07330 [Ktedonobacterales bacterium]|nr:hypothetical protein [Ktedonobacterales bacterium]
MPVQKHAAEEAAHYPTNHIIAVINERQEAERAAHALRDSGFTHVDLLSGADSLHMVHQQKDQQNPLDKFWESARKALTEAESSEQAYMNALRQGRSVVMTLVADSSDADRADEILQRYHAHSVQHFGEWTITNLPDATGS